MNIIYQEWLMNVWVLCIKKYLENHSRFIKVRLKIIKIDLYRFYILKK